jgi:hypothetical protein
MNTNIVHYSVYNNDCLTLFLSFSFANAAGAPGKRYGKVLTRTNTERVGYKREIEKRTTY